MPDVNILINATDKASGAIRNVDGEVKNLDKSAADASGSGGGLAQLGNFLGTGLKTAAIAAVAALTAIGTAVAVTGVKFDDMKQQATIAFTTMLGSGEKAKAFLDDLQKFAASTPFEFPELVRASQRLLAMGFAADRVRPLLTSVGDAVAGLGGNSEMIDRVTVALGQMQAKGKVSSEEMMQLTEAGIPAWQFLADAIGKSVPEAMDLVSGASQKAAKDQGLAWKTLSDGTLEAIPKMKSVAQAAKESSLDVGTAITAITDGMNAKFGGLMEKQSHTFGGLFSTIKDTFTQVSGQVMQPFFDMMTAGFQKIVDFTSTGTFTAGVDAFTHAMKMAADAAQAFFSDIFDGQPFLDALSHALAILLPPSVFGVWDKFKGAIQAVFDVITGNTPVLTFLSDLWTKTWAMAQDIFKQATDYVVANLPTWISTLKGWADAAWQWLVDATPQVVARLADWYKAITGYVMGNLPAWITTLKSWGVAAWQWIVDVVPTVLQKIGGWYSTIEGYIVNALPGFIKLFIEWETAIFKWIDDALPKAIDAISGFVQGLRGEGDNNGGKQFAAMASGWASKLWRWIQDELIPAVGPAFTKFISTLLHLGQDLLTSLGGLAVQLGKTLWQWIVDITPTALLKLADWGGALWGWIKTNAPTWKDYLAEWGGLAWTWIRDVAIPRAVDQLDKWGAALWGWLKENVPAWTKALDDWGLAAWAWIRDVATPKALAQLDVWFAALDEWFKTNWPKWSAQMTQAGKDAMQWLQDGIEYGWDKARDWFFSDNAFGRFVGDILQVLDIQTGPAYGVFYDHGKKLVYSLNEGSRFGLDALRKTGADMGDAISGGLQENMNMHSPSLRMFGYGQDVSQGFLDGVASYASQFSEAGQAIGNGVAAGLKSSIDTIADKLKQAMALANATFQGEVATFARQAAATYQQQYLAIANAPIDAAAALKNAGVDASKVIGYGPNGELILPGTTNLPTSSPTPAPPPPPTTTIGSISSTPANVKDLIAGIRDFLSQTVNSSTINNLFRDVGASGNSPTSKTGEGYSTLQKAQGALRSSMADLLGLPQIYGSLDTSGNLAALTKSLSSGTDLNKIAALLQNAVDFRTLANYYDPSHPYSKTGITDPRLGGISGATNNITIQLQGSNSAPADILSIVQMLGSLYGSATP